MASLSSSHRTKTEAGFTLIELMLVIGLVAIVGGASVIFGMDSFRGYAFHTDRDMIVATLQHARAQAIGNICIDVSGIPCDDGKPHGVAVVGTHIVAFQGSSYVTRDGAADVSMELNPTITYAGTTEFVFAQLSATSSAGTITLTDSVGRSSAITVGTEGQIIWTH